MFGYSVSVLTYMYISIRLAAMYVSGTVVGIYIL